MEGEPEATAPSYWTSVANYPCENPLSFWFIVICGIATNSGIYLIGTTPVNTALRWLMIEIWLKSSSDYEINKETLLDVKNTFRIVESNLGLLGFYVVACCFCGFLAVSIKKEYQKYRKSAMISYFALGILLVIFLLAFGLINDHSYRRLHKIHEDHANTLGKLIRETGYGDPETRQQLKYFNIETQSQLMCCGVDGPDDWKKTGIPIGCRKDIQKLTEDQLKNLTIYIPRKDAHDRSCRSFAESLMYRCQRAVTYPLFFNAVVMFFGIVLAIFLWRQEL